MEKQEKKNTTEAAPPPRRRLIRSWFWGLITAVACLELGWLLSSLLSRRHRLAADGAKPVLVSAGTMAQFMPGQVTAVPQGQFYLSCLEDGSFLAVSRTCTHLGCSLPWDEKRQAFVCPCHGSTFDRTGQVLSPPATRPLDYYPARIENGVVKVDVSRAHRRERFEPSQAVKF